MSDTQPKDITSAGTPLNPPIYKTFVPKGLIQPNAQPNFTTFFNTNRYTTGTATDDNPSGSTRSFDFIKDQLVGSGTDLNS